MSYCAWILHLCWPLNRVLNDMFFLFIHNNSRHYLFIRINTCTEMEKACCPADKGHERLAAPPTAHSQRSVRERGMWKRSDRKVEKEGWRWSYCNIKTKRWWERVREKENDVKVRMD